MAAKYDRNPLPHRRLRVGDRGDDVKRLQIATGLRLKRKGYKEVPKVDGVYGPNSHTLYGRACYVIGLNHRHPTVGQQRLVRWPWLRSSAMKKKEQARRPKRPKAGQLTTHFHLSEFNCRDGTPVPSYMADDLKRWCEIFGEPLRAKYGACAINSGYRHTAYNASVGGERNSFHIYTVRKSQPAADQMYSRGNAEQWGATARSLRSSRNGGRGGVGVYPRSRFIHCDTRTYASDWRG